MLGKRLSYRSLPSLLIVAAGLACLLPLDAGARHLSPAYRGVSVGSGSANPIVRENKRRGTKVLRSLTSTAQGRAIEGYASQTSYAPGEVLQFHVSTTPAASYQIRIYRIGYYKGLGARFIRCMPGCKRAEKGSPQPMDQPDPTTGIVSEHWPVTDSLRIPRSWVSGGYVLQLVLASGPDRGRYTNVPIIIRRAPASRPSKILIISAVNTAAAYNSWGGKSLYTFNSTNGVAANHVSFNRPGAGGVSPLFDLPIEYFLEQNGFDVSYETDVDVQRDPAELLRHRLVIVLGHSEYWSRKMRDAYEAARDHGVNMAFIGGDHGDWQIRYEDNERTVVGYKLAPDPDPNPADKTTNFSHLKPPRPQCQLIGTQFGGGHGPIHSYGINAAALSDPWFQGTGFKAGDTFAGNDLEYDLAAPKGCLPYPLTTFWADATRPTVGPAVRYVAASGAKVFGVGSFAFQGAMRDARVRRFLSNAVTDLSR